ncbi:MAG: BglI family type II restriction endonuclease [Gemmataceae bacterium]
MSIDPRTLTNDTTIVENVEKASTRLVCQAVLDFASIAREQFLLAKDLVATVGEDVTCDALETMGLSRIPTARLIGKIDYKRVVYYFDPDYWIRQALFVDSKAEKGSPTTATIQISQTSLRVRMVVRGDEVDEPGVLDAVLTVGDERYLVTTIFVKYHYQVNQNGDNELLNSFIVCLPNGILQDKYNPDANNTVWNGGRNAPTHGEDFRVRISFHRLKALANWRVQRIQSSPTISFIWDD